jgi:hypothetical protein
MLHKAEKLVSLPDIKSEIPVKNEAVIKSLEMFYKIANEIVVRQKTSLSDMKEEIALLTKESHRFKQAHEDAQNSIKTLKNIIPIEDNETIKQLKSFFEEYEDLALAVSQLEFDFHFFNPQLQPNQEAINRYLSIRHIIIKKLIHHNSDARDFVLGMYELHKNNLLHTTGYLELVALQPPKCAKDMAWALTSLYQTRALYKKGKEDDHIEWIKQYSGNASMVAGGFHKLIGEKIFDDEAYCRAFLTRLFEECSCQKAVTIIGAFVTLYNMDLFNRKNLYTLIEERDYFNEIMAELVQNFNNFFIRQEVFDNIIQSIKVLSKNDEKRRSGPVSKMFSLKRIERDDSALLSFLKPLEQKKVSKPG